MRCRGKSLGKSKTLLDIGCGVGTTLKKIVPRVREAYGVDISRLLVDEARRNAPSNVHFKRADARSLPFPDDKFDVVICQRGPATVNVQFAREMSRVLKKGGTYVGMHIGERDKENIKRIFGRGQLYAALLKRASEAKRQIELLRRVGFRNIQAKEYNLTEYFAGLPDLISRLERFPMIPRFHRIKDKRFLKIIEEKLWDGKGIKTNIHRVMIRATK